MFDLIDIEVVDSPIFLKSEVDEMLFVGCSFVQVVVWSWKRRKKCRLLVLQLDLVLFQWVGWVVLLP